MRRKLLSALVILVLLISVAPSVFADSQDTAYLMYADAGWTYQYWGEDAEGGIQVSNATVTGAGDYSVGIDFSGTETGQAEGLAFAAVGIMTGEETFPGYFIEITSIKVNGTEVDFSRGYTSTDDGITTRMNIYNEWVGEIPDEARSFDGDLSDVSPIIIDKADFSAVRSVEVAFTLHEGSADTAFLMYADGSWTYQYWGDEAENGISVTNAVVTGAGVYTVGIDFTGTEDGQASGLAFSAVGIAAGEETFPGYFIEITSIKVNGSDINFAKGFTSTDDGITTRMNIFNEWVGEIPDEARSFDGDLSDVSPIIIDKSDFDAVQKIEVTFTLHVGSADTAFLMYADGDWTYQYWGGETEDGIIANNATVSGDGSYTVGLDFTATAAGSASGIAFTALGIETGEKTFPGSFIEITAIRINGSEINVDRGYTSSDDGVVTRMNIFNEWVGTLPEEARTQDGNLEDVSWIIVDKADFENVRTVEVDFDFIVGDGPATAEEIDVEAALAADYNAYFGVQTVSYTFRNAWNDSYGIDTPNWDRLTGWDEGNVEVNYGGSLTDAVITGNGTYTVSLELGEMGFGSDQEFNMLFVSTDIPSALFIQEHLEVSNVLTSMDGGTQREFTFVDTEERYARITVMNTYNNEVGTETIPYSMPKERIDITFTISGFDRDAAPAPAAAEGLSAAAIIGIIAGLIIVLLAVVVLLRTKMKKKT
ncbi:hypothetical protein [Spirochaeta dissipatitropha]